MGNLNLPGWGGKFESELSSMSSENTSGGRQGSGSPGEQGAGEGRCGIYMRAGSGSRSKYGDTKFVVYYWVLFSQKHLPGKVLKFPFNIHQCLKENFGSKKT